MAPTPLLSLADQTLDNTIGAILIGIVGAALVFGITTLQTYWYYHTYPNDALLHKCSVAVLWTLDAFHLALVVHAVYTYAVIGFGNWLRLLEITWSIKLQASINVVIVLIVHSLYAMRVWLLGGYHRGILGYIVALVVLGGFAIGIVLAYLIYTIRSYIELESISWAINAALATSTTIDFIIAGAMCYYLRKSKGSITRLNSRISTVMQYTLSSGLFTSACSLSAMFCYILLPNTFIFLALEFLLTKLYVGSFIAMLNARERKRDGVCSCDGLATEPSWSWKRHLNLHTASSSRSPRPQSTLTLNVPQSPPEILKTPLSGYA
ncbi:hypothetical protein CPB84DRAFT_1807936 [Gymnopilus junonius]|uniref:DUF6534 domain-containing protein n=1 Tax=Gymnopilus junonius TaxID=109634 RepID=A0A9P5TEF2_GYMJU|nr:hypothetical protein CPB84DRAFT_1807936 [Gymnopilus junonius]